jgi:hypothetical protein
MAPAGCELIDVQVVKYYKTIAYITCINIHHILWKYHITNTPCKNKLDASNLLIACFTWLMGATLKNGSYLRKATMLILGLPKSCCKSDDNYSGRYRHPSCMVDDQLGTPRGRCDEHSSKFYLSYETKVKSTSRRKKPLLKVEANWLLAGRTTGASSDVEPAHNTTKILCPNL